MSCDINPDCTNDSDFREDGRLVTAPGDLVGHSIGPLAVAGASVDSVVVTAQAPSNLTQLPITLILDCAGAGSTIYAADQSRNADWIQFAWMHFEVEDPAGLAYSIVTSGPTIAITGSDLLGGPGTGNSYDHAHWGYATLTLIADPDDTGIPAGPDLSSASPNLFKGTNDADLPWVGSTGALLTVTATAPNPAYQRPLGSYSAKQGGAATGFLPQGAYTLGLHCRALTSASFEDGRSYQGGVSSDATVTLVLSDPTP